MNEEEYQTDLGVRKYKGIHRDLIVVDEEPDLFSIYPYQPHEESYSLFLIFLKRKLYLITLHGIQITSSPFIIFCEIFLFSSYAITFQRLPSLNSPTASQSLPFWLP